MDYEKIRHKSGSIFNLEPVVDRAAHINYPAFDEQDIESHRAGLYYIGFGGGAAVITGGDTYGPRPKGGRRRSTTTAHATHHRHGNNTKTGERTVSGTPRGSSIGLEGILPASTGKVAFKEEMQDDDEGSPPPETVNNEKRHHHSKEGTGKESRNYEDNRRRSSSGRRRHRKRLPSIYDEYEHDIEKARKSVGEDEIIDPAEHVHFILESGNGPNDMEEPGRLFIQMDELRFIPIQPEDINSGASGQKPQQGGLSTSPTRASGLTDDTLLLNVRKEKGTSGSLAGTPQTTSPPGIVTEMPVWEEVARWVKFEEDVEPGSNRWSKPRVATLALHSLLELRSCILNGLLILDMEASSALDIENNLISALISSHQITPELEDEIRKILRAPHIPQYMKISHFRHVASRGHFPNITSIPVIQAKISSVLNPMTTNGQSQPNMTAETPLNNYNNLNYNNNNSNDLFQQPHNKTNDSGDTIVQPEGNINAMNITRNTSNVQTPVGHPPLMHYASVPLPSGNQQNNDVSTPISINNFDDKNPLSAQSTKPLLAPKISGAKKFKKGLASVLHHSKTSPVSLSPLKRENSDQVISSRALNSASQGIDGKPIHHIRSASAINGNNGQQIGNGALTEEPKEHPKFGNVQFMKKLPENAEAAHVLIGEALCLQTPIIAFIRLHDSIYMTDATEVPIPTRFMFVLIGPNGYIERYHEIGRCLATLLSDEVFHDVAYKAKNIQDILAGVDEFLDQVIVLPPGEWDPTIRIQPPLNIPSQMGRIKKTPTDKNGGEKEVSKLVSHVDPLLVRTGRCCGGLRDDVKRKWPWYFWSDFVDGLHPQCIASFFFLYFACLAPIVTFGGLLGNATGYNLATIESLLSGALCGIAWALFAGQPLTIMGSTGPILVFESIVYSFCRDHQLNYLSMRCCIGLWTAIILLIMVVTDASVLVKYVTRFTEEIFASLISLIFIYQALLNIYQINKAYPVKRFRPLPMGAAEALANAVNINDNETLEAITPSSYTLQTTVAVIDGIYRGNRLFPFISDVFFLSVILFLGTYLLSSFLKSLRNTTYFPMSVRYTISDFSVLLAVLAMLGIDYYYGLPTPKLMVPSSFRPTSPTRKGWFVTPFGIGNPWWIPLITIFPALLCTILIFLDQQITAVIINRKENLLRKGYGYHLDLLIVAFLVAACSLLGIPWFVAATVLSITHLNSLKKETECAAPGERPKFLGIREQRLTGLFIFTMIGLSVIMTKTLSLIPMPVLYGVFLYMGISSLNGVQFMQRLSIIFMPQKYQPDYMFLRSVKTYRVHLFTAIQAASLAALWAIKSFKTISICFPIMVAALVAIRKLMEKIFTQRELSILDDLMPESDKGKNIDLDHSPLSTDQENDAYEPNNNITNVNDPENYLKGNRANMRVHKPSQFAHFMYRINPFAKKLSINQRSRDSSLNPMKKYFRLSSSSMVSSGPAKGFKKGDIGSVERYLKKGFTQTNPNHVLINNQGPHTENAKLIDETPNNEEIKNNSTKGEKTTNHQKYPESRSYPFNILSKKPERPQNIDIEAQELLIPKTGEDQSEHIPTIQNDSANKNGPPTYPNEYKKVSLGSKVTPTTSAVSHPHHNGGKLSVNSQAGNINHHHQINDKGHLPHTLSMVDAMNITREVEKTAIWKSLAKEKFINSASTSDMSALNGQSSNKSRKKQSESTKKLSSAAKHLSPLHSEPDIDNDKHQVHETDPKDQKRSKFTIAIGDDDFQIPKNLTPNITLTPPPYLKDSPHIIASHPDSVILDPAKSTSIFDEALLASHHSDKDANNAPNIL